VRLINYGKNLKSLFSINALMDGLLDNAREFLNSAKDNFVKKRYNVSASDYFKSIVIFCDYLIYGEIKRLPKNHNDRFNLLKSYFNKIYEKVSFLFGIYIKSYNLKTKREDVLKLEKCANEIKEFIGC